MEIEYKNTSTKLENDLRHSQSYVHNLQNDLEKSKDECSRLEREWEAYKLRVKSMLSSKDKEIKAFQDGLKFNDDNKTLVDQLQNLRYKHFICNIFSSVEREVRVVLKSYSYML